MRDYYYILGIPDSATEKEIKTAYRKLSLKFHPDKNDGEKFFEERFKQIQEAYEILSQPAKRAEYDERLNQFNSSRTNRDYLKNYEEELKRNFEEEFLKRESEIKKDFQDRENRIRAAANKKIKDEFEKINNQPVKKTTFNPIYIVIAVILGIVFYLVINKSNENSSTLMRKLPDEPVDSLANNLPGVSSPIQNFTNNEFFNADNITLIIDSTQWTLSKFPDESYLNEHKSWRKYNFSDVDGDNVPELLTEYFTGGFHCCYVYNFFQQISRNTYRCIFSYEGGENSIKIDDNKLAVSFYEQLGYFYTSYARNIDNELPNGSFNPHLNLIYKEKDLVYDDEDTYFNKLILEDLEYLKSRPIPALDSTDFDDGTRKSYAEHIITYFFNKAENWDSTKLVFKNYYHSSDSVEVWNIIERHINSIFNMQFANDYHHDMFLKLSRNFQIMDTNQSK